MSMPAASSVWKYYQNALVPTTPPHQPPKMTKNIREQLFRHYPKALFIRWHSDYDCGEETKWWYCIKDSVYDIGAMASRHRYKITKARRYFEVRTIAAKEYASDLCDVWVQSLQGYAERDRIAIDTEQYIRKISEWDCQPHLTVFGAFSRESGKLCGFTLMAQQETVFHLSSQKTIPAFEKYGVNAALVDGVLTEYNPYIEQGYYICDGARNILHQTRFQEYLEKYFGFRKAYCRLHIAYRTGFGLAVKILGMFRGVLKTWDSVSIIHKINGVLTLEQCCEKYSYTDTK